MASTDSASAAGVPAPVFDAAAKKLERRKRFEAVFPLIKQELLEYLDECKMPSDARAWFDRVSHRVCEACIAQPLLTADPACLVPLRDNNALLESRIQHAWR